MKTHLTLLVGLAICGVAFWFELRRAEGGNALSWAYVFEWPLLGGFAVYMWWKILNPTSPAKRRRPEKPLAPQYAGMLLNWQKEQQELERIRKAGEGVTCHVEGDVTDAATKDT